MGEGGGGRGEKRSFSPSALSFFRFHLSPFPPETPDTQAMLYVVCLAFFCWCHAVVIHCWLLIY